MDDTDAVLAATKNGARLSRPKFNGGGIDPPKTIHRVLRHFVWRHVRVAAYEFDGILARLVNNDLMVDVTRTATAADLDDADFKSTIGRLHRIAQGDVVLTIPTEIKKGIEEDAPSQKYDHERKTTRGDHSMGHVEIIARWADAFAAARGDQLRRRRRRSVHRRTLLEHASRAPT